MVMHQGSLAGARGLAAALVTGLLCLGGAQAQPTGRGAPHATRTVQAFADLEETLLQAIRAHDVTRLEQMVDDDFQMIVAQAPDAPVAREDWIDALGKPGAGDGLVEHLAVRERGEMAVAGFVLRGSGARRQAPPLYVVDTWQRAEGGWRLLLRQVAPASGARRGIPGDGPSQTVRKKY